MSAPATPRRPRPSPGRSGTLAQRFIVPPFTVLDARQGYWRERHAAWLALGVHGELGRPERLTFDPSARPPCLYKKKERYEAALGRRVSWPEFLDAHPDLRSLPTTSIFDPVVAELAYCWFCPPGGSVLDPFAGGSVRGLVAAHLGRPYLGLDLRPEQVAANRAQAAAVAPAVPPRWQTADARELGCLAVEPVDFVFTCPPYADLERYSTDPRDLSAMRYDQFQAAYREVIAAALGHLRDDRFAALLVGDVRDRSGYYRGLAALTIEAFRAAGARCYNEAVYLPPLGSLPTRAGRQFAAGRKLGRAHQTLLVFVKGDARRAAAAVGQVEVTPLAKTA